MQSWVWGEGNKGSERIPQPHCRRGKETRKKILLAVPTFFPRIRNKSQNLIKQQAKFILLKKKNFGCKTYMYDYISEAAFFVLMAGRPLTIFR